MDQFTTEPVAYTAVSEPWTEIVLNDGTKLRMRTIVTDVRRVVGQTDQNGMPVYQISTTQVFKPPVAPKPMEAAFGSRQ